MTHHNLMVFLLDVIISILASAFAILVVRWQAHPIHEFDTCLLVWLAFSAAASIVSFLIIQVYKMVIFHASMRLVAKLIYSTAIKELILFLCIIPDTVLSRNGVPFQLLFLIDFSATAILLILFRLAIIDVISVSRKDLDEEINKLSVMVYGVSDKSISMITRLSQSKHFNICGFLSSDPSRQGQIIADHKVYVFRTESDIDDLKARLGVESILFSNDTDAEKEKERLVSLCLDKGINVLMTPHVESINYGGMTNQAIKDVVDKEYIPDAMSSFERNTKRIWDLLFSAILLVVLSPLMLICWIALKIGDGGPAIYSQERIGRFGRPFKIYKFRSMRLNAEDGGPQLYAGDDDPRLTKVGGFLRRHHLDELPQLWNVFCGDMAFVGYRPERKFYIDQIMEKDPRYYYLYQIRPGVTSYATLRNGYTDSMEKMLRRLEFDLYYLRHRSWLFDLAVIWQTFLNVAFGKKF